MSPLYSPQIALRETFRSGFYYTAPGASVTSSKGTINSAAYATPFFVPTQITVACMGIQVAVIGAGAGPVARFGFFADDGNGYPGSLIFDAGTVVTTSTGYVEVTGLTQVLSPGYYWPTVAFQGSATTAPTVYGTTGDVVGLACSTSGSTLVQNAISCWVQTSGMSGALPASFGAGGSGNSVAPRIAVKVT